MTETPAPSASTDPDRLPAGRTPPLDPDEADRLFRRGVALFNGVRYWHAHEAWETLWRAAPDDERDFYQGLIQVAAGLLHLQRRNLRGARNKLAEGLAKLRDRKAQRERVETAVRDAMGKLTFAEAEARLKAAGLGFNEVMPLERVLDAPQAHQPGKLRELDFRGLHFEVPEFPGQREVEPNLPPPEIGEHTVELLRELGYSDAESAALLDGGAAKAYAPGDFAWAPVRQKA